MQKDEDVASVVSAMTKVDCATAYPRTQTPDLEDAAKLRGLMVTADPAEVASGSVK